MNLRALGDTGAVLRAYAFSTVCDKFMHLPPPSNHWWFEYLTEGGATAPVGRADSCSRANARRCIRNRSPSQVSRRFRKKEPPLPVAKASAHIPAAPGQFGRHTRHRLLPQAQATPLACLEHLSRKRMSAEIVIGVTRHSVPPSRQAAAASPARWACCRAICAKPRSPLPGSQL